MSRETFEPTGFKRVAIILLRVKEALHWSIDLTHDASHRIINDFTYFDNASYSASQRLLVTRTTEVLKILHILMTRAIPRANSYL